MEYRLLLVAWFIVGAVSLLSLRKRNNRSVMYRLSSWLPFLARSQRSEESQPPPRSTTPEKKAPIWTDSKGVFPPSVRENLAKAASTSPGAQPQYLKGNAVNETEVEKNLIPMTADYRECGPSTYTPMGLSTEEVNALGDFPDYSSLSGVPLPSAYKEFNISSAIPRPYRPFRWAYHQTMCKTLYI